MYSGGMIIWNQLTDWYMMGLTPREHLCCSSWWAHNEYWQVPPSHLQAKSCCYVNTIQIEKAPETQQSQASSPPNFVSADLALFIHVLWTKGGLGQLCMKVESGEGARRCFFHFLLFFQVSSYLLVFIYFSLLIPLYQKAWRHICYIG